MQRIDYRSAFPQAVQAMIGLEQAVHASTLEPSLIELIKMRASQINGCAHCLDMHSKDARASGETEQRLYLLNAWREAPCYSDRERAALDWCESLTQIADKGAPDEVYQRLTAQFDQEQIVALTLAIVAINGWNRLAISTQIVHRSRQNRRYIPRCRQTPRGKPFLVVLTRALMRGDRACARAGPRAFATARGCCRLSRC